MFSFRFFSLCFVVLLPLHLVYFDYAPVNVNPVGGGGEGGVRARGGDLTSFEIFGSNSTGWETKGRWKVSEKPPPQGKKSKQTIL